MMVLENLGYAIRVGDLHIVLGVGCAAVLGGWCRGLVYKGEKLVFIDARFFRCRGRRRREQPGVAMLSFICIVLIMSWLTVVTTWRGYSSACDSAENIGWSTRALLPFPYPPLETTGGIGNSSSTT
jgi:hypothetical protein